MHVKKVWWKQCQTCGKASTGIGYTVHRRFKGWCCGEPVFKESARLKALNQTFDYPGYWRYVEQVENAQIEYAIAWGVE